MSDIDDIKAHITSINAKVDVLISVIPDEKLALAANPDVNLAKIDELNARVAEVGDIEGALTAIDTKLDNAIAQAREVNAAAGNAGFAKPLVPGTLTRTDYQRGIEAARAGVPAPNDLSPEGDDYRRGFTDGSLPTN